MVLMINVNVALSLFICIVYLIFTGFIISFVVFILYALINKNYIEKAPVTLNFKEGEKYVGLVITTTNISKYKTYAVYGSGPKLMIERLKKANVPYKLIKDVTKDAFSELVYDPNCHELYILGHGRRYGLQISEKRKSLFKKYVEYILYEDFKDAPKKGKVVQMHCNHDPEKTNKPSLTSVLNAQSDFKQMHKRTLIQEIIYIWRHFYKS